jgi:AhpD family alkylhydroperoxidase
MSYAETIDHLREPTRNLRRIDPSVWERFGGLYREVMSPGALSVASKELIALAISVVEGCDGCIASHARSVVRAGASPTEVAEALGVALLMGGGPASINAPRAWEAYCEFYDAARAGADVGAEAAAGDEALPAT